MRQDETSVIRTSSSQDQRKARDGQDSETVLSTVETQPAGSAISPQGQYEDEPNASRSKKAIASQAAKTAQTLDEEEAGNPRDGRKGQRKRNNSRNRRPSRKGQSAAVPDDAPKTKASQKTADKTSASPGSNDATLYAALDLGTNNCRLLIAEPYEKGFRIVDSFSKIVRLGEGISSNNRLSDEASDRAIQALRICWNKLKFHKITKARLIATEACRSAENGKEFLGRVSSEIGLELEIVDRETEAKLAMTGCISLVEPRSDGVVLFDIGGGSSEIVWMDRRGRRKRNRMGGTLRAWDSLPIGVVTLSERHNGRDVTPASFESMVQEVQERLENFPKRKELLHALSRGRHHLLGTSGTVTTLAGVHLGLRRYDRRRVDGMWMSNDDASKMVEQLLDLSYNERVKHPCIGGDRADLVLPGCAIFEAIRREFTCDQLRVADRGLREGILVELMREDGHNSVRKSDRNNRWRRRQHNQKKNDKREQT